MKISIRRILCPVDFSASSSHAIRYALAFASAHEATLVLLHVLEPAPYPLTDFPATPPVPVETESELKEGAEERLAEVVAELRQHHADVIAELGMGVPHEEIIQFAKAEEIDLVVMGTHGHTGLVHMLLGSVAEKVVRRAPCPVLVVKDPEHEFVTP
jgi:nucleotide-binding universal stress UspA family protein